MFARHFVFAALLIFGVTVIASSSASPDGVSATRNRNDAQRAAEAARVAQKKQVAAARKAQRGAAEAAARAAEEEAVQYNSGGHRTTGILRPKKSRRDIVAIEDLVRRAVDEALFRDLVYARGRWSR